MMVIEMKYDDDRDVDDDDDRDDTCCQLQNKVNCIYSS